MRGMAIVGIDYSYDISNKIILDLNASYGPGFYFEMDDTYENIIYSDPGYVYVYEKRWLKVEKPTGFIFLSKINYSLKEYKIWFYNESSG